MHCTGANLSPSLVALTRGEEEKLASGPGEKFFPLTTKTRLPRLTRDGGRDDSSYLIPDVSMSLCVCLSLRVRNEMKLHVNADLRQLSHLFLLSLTLEVLCCCPRPVSLCTSFLLLMLMLGPSFMFASLAKRASCHHGS